MPGPTMHLSYDEAFVHALYMTGGDGGGGGEGGRSTRSELGFGDSADAAATAAGSSMPRCLVRGSTGLRHRHHGREVGHNVMDRALWRSKQCHPLSPSATIGYRLRHLNPIGHDVMDSGFDGVNSAAHSPSATHVTYLLPPLISCQYSTAPPKKRTMGVIDHIGKKPPPPPDAAATARAAVVAFVAAVGWACMTPHHTERPRHESVIGLAHSQRHGEGDSRWWRSWRQWAGPV